MLYTKSYTAIPASTSIQKTKERISDPQKVSKKGQRGRSKVKYKLGAHLLKRLDQYKDRWKYGLPINIRTKNGDKFRMSSDYNNSVNKISIKLRKGEYELYEYLVT